MPPRQSEYTIYSMLGASQGCRASPWDMVGEFDGQLLRQTVLLVLFRSGLLI